MVIRSALLSILLVLAAQPGRPQESSSVDEWTVAISRDYSIIPNVTYAVADNYECTLDAYVHRASPGPTPTLIHIHGGGWVTGTKETAILGLLPYFARG